MCVCVFLSVEFYIFQTDHLVLDNQLLCSSPRKTVSLTSRIPELSVLHLSKVQETLGRSGAERLQDSEDQVGCCEIKPPSLSESTSIKSHQHDCPSESQARMALIGLPKWTELGPYPYTKGYRPAFISEG